MIEADATEPTARHQPLRAWLLVARRAFHGFLRHRGIDAAAALTFFACLALFPAALALVSGLALLYGEDRAVDLVLGVATELVRPSTVSTISAPLTELLSVQRPIAGLVFGLGLSLWSLSAYCTAFGRAMNGVFEVQEGRPFWRFRAAMLVVAAMLSVLFTLILAVLISTPRLLEAVGVPAHWADLWQFVRWPLLVILPVITVALLYYATPVVRFERQRWVTHGAVVAIATWGAGSAAFSFYVSSVGQYDRIYGWLGGAIVLLLWLYITNIALVVGGEINAEVMRLRMLGAGIAAEESIPLSMRDTRRNHMLARQRTRDVADSRALRED